MNKFVGLVLVAALCLFLPPEAVAQCQLGQAALIEPTGGTVPFGQIVLSWAPVSGATSYEPFISVDGDPPFNLGETTSTSVEVTIDPGRNVLWKVKANAPSCASSLSDHAIFNTSCPAQIPEILTPPAGAQFAAGSTVDFSWTAVPGAVSYDIILTPDFGQTFQNLVENHPGTSYSAVIENGDWGFTIRANFDSCAPNFAEPSHFFVGEQCANPAPELLSPDDGETVTLPVTLEWSAVPGVEAYNVFVMFGGELHLIGRTSDTSFEVERGVEGEVVWAVGADFPGECPSMVSEPRTMIIEGSGECGTGEAVPVSPANGATNLTSPVSFSWNGVAGATLYRVLATIGGNDIVSLGETTDTHLTADVPAGSGFWVVQTFFGENCPSTVSDRFALTVSRGATCDDAGPTLVSPANNATDVDSPVTFKWTAVDNATKYALFVSTQGDDFDLYGVTEETEIEGFVPAGIVRWFVVAHFASCPETRSAVFAFVAGRQGNCPAGTIALQSPPQNATVSSPVTLSWSTLAGVEFYRLTILVDGETAVTKRTTSTSETIELPAGQHRWIVEGIREGCEPVVSNEGVFTVQRAANCDANQPPAIVSPAGTQSAPTIVTSPVTFTWTAANNAIGYRLWVSRNGNAFEDIGVTTQTTAQIPLPPGVYAWYLDAVFRGCDELRSGTAYFAISETEARCPSEAPILLNPVGGSTAEAPVTFTWSEVHNAKYRVFASIDGSEERLIGTTEDTELTRALPPGLVTWRVEAVAEECRAVSSLPSTFTIPESSNCSDDKPELLSPANDATLTEREVDFAWTPVSGAVRYLLLAQTEDGSRVPIGETTETSFTRRMPFGEITWSVVAFFAGCEPVESLDFTFTITPPQNCSTRSPILILPSETAPDVFSPVTFAFTPVPGATGYQIWVPQGSPAVGKVAETTENIVEVELPPGQYEAFVVATFANCPSTESARVSFKVHEPVPCGTPDQTEAHVVGQALSGTPYRLRWAALPNVQSYEVQESLTADFANAETFLAEQPAMRFVHQNSGAPLQYFYRVRGISTCDDSRGSFSEPVAIFIIGQRTNNSSAELGVEGTIVQTVVLQPQNPPLQFVARVDKPWLTVTPATGTVGAEPVTLTVTADPAFLALGTNTGTVRVEYTAPAGSRITTHATTTTTVPISVSLVTPVTPAGKGTPPPDALIFPIVGHAAGVNDSLFESDIRVANLTPQTMKYQVTFTPSNTDGTQTGSVTTIDVPPNTTTALDDIVASVFGTGTTSSALGMMEIRPLTTTNNTSTSLFSAVGSTFPSLATAASSRTYNFTPNGTFGQYIPAIPFAKFVGRGTTLSLLQVAQSPAYRANFGFAEASGSPVDLEVRVFDTKNALLARIPLSLGAMQHQQLNGLLSQNGITDLADGRVEVEVLNGNGKVTAYVSEIDNKTNDPLLVNAVPKGGTSASRYVVPGMAYINNGFAFWVSDLRIFNAGAASTPATVTFYPQGNGAPVSKDIVVDAGEIEVLNNVVGDFFGLPNGAGGAIAITTPSNTQLSATARTYNQTSNGTYGQFIPGVTVAESVGAGDRALQLLQLETSSRMRTNIGVSETSGQPVTIEISAIQPDSIVTPVITLSLAANEFRQLSLAEFFESGAAVYNARVTVKVIGGTGRVTAYGSAIDVITQDPTYVPAM